MLSAFPVTTTSPNSFSHQIFMLFKKYILYSSELILFIIAFNSLSLSLSLSPLPLPCVIHGSQQINSGLQDLEG